MNEDILTTRGGVETRSAVSNPYTFTVNQNYSVSASMEFDGYRVRILCVHDYGSTGGGDSGAVSYHDTSRSIDVDDTEFSNAAGAMFLSITLEAFDHRRAQDINDADGRLIIRIIGSSASLGNNCTVTIQGHSLTATKGDSSSSSSVLVYYGYYANNANVYYFHDIFWKQSGQWIDIYLKFS